MARTLPLYVQNFQTAYENLYKLYLSKETFTHIDKNVTKTKEFIQYAKAVKEVIQVKMNTGNKKKSNDIEGPNQSSNKAMVESLRASGEYNYYKIDYSSDKKTSSSANSDVFIVDEVLDHLFTEILGKDIEKCFFLSKGDARYAFNSISLCTHNELVDMCRKLPKPIPIYSPKDGDRKVCYKMVHLDDTVVDSQGNTEFLGAITADPNRDTEYEAIYSAILTYGITSFVHEMVADFIKNNKLFEMLEYLNNISEGQPIELYEEIHNDGFDHALRTIVKRLEKMDIDVRYLNNLHLNWKKNNKDIKKNSPNHWKDQAYTLVDAMVSKKKLF